MRTCCFCGSVGSGVWFRGVHGPRGGVQSQEGMVPGVWSLGYGPSWCEGITPPPPPIRQTPVKTLPSIASLMDGKNMAANGR